MIIWQKPSRCESGSCVEVARGGDMIYVRDSKLGVESSVKRFSLVAWAEIVTDLAAGRPWPWIEFYPLAFSPAERAAFVAAVRAGEYDHLTEGTTGHDH